MHEGRYAGQVALQKTRLRLPPPAVLAAEQEHAPDPVAQAVGRREQRVEGMMADQVEDAVADVDGRAARLAVEDQLVPPRFVPGDRPRPVACGEEVALAIGG